MMSKKEKLQSLGFMYILPIISMIIFALNKDIEINGEQASWYINASVGFAFGIGVEGALLILGATIAVIAGKV